MRCVKPASLMSVHFVLIETTQASFPKNVGVADLDAATLKLLLLVLSHHSITCNVERLTVSYTMANPKV